MAEGKGKQEKVKSCLFFSSLTCQMRFLAGQFDEIFQGDFHPFPEK